ncbi:MAG: hypothetical protein WC518_03410 [Patescibacteria group bacterium]
MKTPITPDYTVLRPPEESESEPRPDERTLEEGRARETMRDGLYALAISPDISERERKILDPFKISTASFEELKEIKARFESLKNITPFPQKPEGDSPSREKAA